jgi:hypothetical protein
MYAKHARIRSRFVVTADGVKPGASPSLQALPPLLALLLFTLTTFGCGGASSKPPSNADSLVEVRVTAGSQLIAAVGGTVPLHADGGYRSATGEITYTDLTNSVSWSTSNPAIATVDKGVVTGAGIGTATISASFGGKSGSITIFVAQTFSITISPAGPFSLSAGSSITFHAIETFSDGSTLDVSGPAFWDSSHGDIVSIYPYLGGDATLVAPGTTTITATLGTGEVGSLDVTVIP